jgi:hypothetical protein
VRLKEPPNSFPPICPPPLLITSSAAAAGSLSLLPLNPLAFGHRELICFFWVITTELSLNLEAGGASQAIALWAVDAGTYFTGVYLFPRLSFCMFRSQAQLVVKAGMANSLLLLPAGVPWIQAVGVIKPM